MNKTGRYRRCSASLTLEASLIIPLFLIGMLSIISLGRLFSINMSVKYAIYEEAKSLAGKPDNRYKEMLNEIEEDVRKLLDSYNTGYRFIENGRAGVSLVNSKLDNEEYVELVASYTFVPFGSDLFNIAKIPVINRCVIHANCGYINGYFFDNYNEYVYITKNSRVYHRNRECSHIKLTIIAVKGTDIEGYRNKNGAKYYSCEACHGRTSDKTLYITPEGNRYHRSVMCSGLKRTVKAIRITEIGDKRPCSKCGQ